MISTTVQLAMMVGTSAKKTIIQESFLFVSGSFLHLLIAELLAAVPVLAAAATAAFKRNQPVPPTLGGSSARGACSVALHWAETDPLLLLLHLGQLVGL